MIDTTSGDDLVRWAEPNNLAMNDPALEAAALGGLHATVPDEYTFGEDGLNVVPLLYFACDPDWEPIPLVDGVVTDFAAEHRRWACDRCLADPTPPGDQLWMPMGESVVVVHCCPACRASLDADYSGLVWR